MELRTTNDYLVLLDDADYASITHTTWRAKRDGRTFYAYPSKAPYGSPYGCAMHRQIMHALSGQLFDHINGNGLDNRRANLRLCSVAENSRNRRAARNGFLGVTWHAQAKRWQAQIRHARKDIYLGLFQTEELAAKAYDIAARKLHGEFARPNFPEIAAP